jgi:hypothetical protein
MQALETVYRGIKFRSRTEARIAIFLQELHANWEYEPEGVKLPYSGNYLPDFWVSNFPVREIDKTSTEKVSFWLEVKGAPCTLDEITKLRELACASGEHGYFGYYKSLQEIVDDCCNPDYVRFIGRPYSSSPFQSHQAPHSVFRPVGGFPGEQKLLAAKGEMDWHHPQVKQFYDELHYKLDHSPFPCKGCDPTIWLRAAQSALAHRFGT